jgi:hypothetical protein
MITIFVILVASAYLTSLVWMLHSLKRSPEGYEDELGFHEGRSLGVVIDASHEFISHEQRAA